MNIISLTPPPRLLPARAPNAILSPNQGPGAQPPLQPHARTVQQRAHTLPRLCPLQPGNTPAVWTAPAHTPVFTHSHPRHATPWELTRPHVHTLVVHTSVCTRIAPPQVVRVRWAPRVPGPYSLSSSALAPVYDAHAEPRETSSASKVAPQTEAEAGLEVRSHCAALAPTTWPLECACLYSSPPTDTYTPVRARVFITHRSHITSRHPMPCVGIHPGTVDTQACGCT